MILESQNQPGRQEIDALRRIAALAVGTLLLAPGHTAHAEHGVLEGHQPAEEAAVLEAMDRFLTAISESDLEAQAAMQTPDGMTYQWRPAVGRGMHITAHPNSYWVDPSQDDGHTYRERYWSPTVMIRGGIAVVWRRLTSE